MFKKILIANRGEIACRIIKTARRLGIHTVAVYSDIDANALHVTMADEAVNIGPAPSRESYLMIERVINAALKTGAQAIHPGYGFLSENPRFASACESRGICFIGPPVAAIEAMGSKSEAKKIMATASVPLIPGYHGEQQDLETLKENAESMGYPVLIKASAGGGGKGMRLVHSSNEFDEALASARREAKSSFSDDRLLVEKYLLKPRHVEIQIFCDQHGNGIYLAERDCSVQRRHQKVIEEAPAPGLSNSLREAVGEAALRCAKAIAYEGAGTVEFLLDADGAFYFMEMNTRLQVEHPVTEMISGQDLVEWQLIVACGETLPLSQEQLVLSGHAFEARVYAEDPDQDFMPACGTLSFLQTPLETQHVRVDTGVVQGDEVSVYYDPMIAKLIVWDENREKALSRMANALREFRVVGVKTNIEFLYTLCTSKPFQSAQIDTSFIEQHHELLFHDSDSDYGDQVLLAALYYLLHRTQQAKSLATDSADPHSPWHEHDAWRLNESSEQQLNICIHDHNISINVIQSGTADDPHYLMTALEHTARLQGELKENRLTANINGHRLQTTVTESDGTYCIFTQDSAVQFTLADPDLGDTHDDTNPGALLAPMNGTVIDLLVEPECPVKAGDPLILIEAMKMEHTLRAPCDGQVSEFYYTAGSLVDGGATLLKFDPVEQE